MKYTNTKIMYGGLIILFTLFVIGVIAVNSREQAQEYTFPKPIEVVEQYFESWGREDYPNMYATLSDGFKKIEPTAKTLQEFKTYVISQNIEDVAIVNIKEKSNDGQTANVDYDVVFVQLNKQKIPYHGSFTLKYREGDVIKGWKLIHPYGEHVDGG